MSLVAQTIPFTLTPGRLTCVDSRVKGLLPNIFSPNGDAVDTHCTGLDDEYGVVLHSKAKLEVTVGLQT